MFIARDKYGKLWLYKEKPVRNKSGECWEPNSIGYTVGELNSTEFPSLKWEDEPLEVVLLPKTKTNKTDITVTRENTIFNDSYWTALRNEAAVAAMQSILEKWNNVSLNSIVIGGACKLSVDCADALIQKLKSKENKI